MGLDGGPHHRTGELAGEMGVYGGFFLTGRRFQVDGRLRRLFPG